MKQGFRVLLGLRPSIGDFASLIPILFLFGRMNGAGTLLGDGDTGWHIRTGEWILAHRQVPHQDIFSFTRPGQPWFAWEWLSDVLMGWLHQVGGMQAVLLGAIVLICITFALLYRLVLHKSGNALIAFALTAIAAAGSSIHWLARPHLFTMLFLVIFYSILEERRMRLLFILPFASLVWTNLHGGFLVGILLVGVYAVGELVGALAWQRQARTGARVWAELALWFDSCGLPGRKLDQSVWLESPRPFDPLFYESVVFSEHCRVCVHQFPAPIGSVF